MSSKRFRRRWVLSLLSIWLMTSAVACSDGPLASKPKVYEGGGPLPQFTGEEVPEKPLKGQKVTKPK